MTKIVLVLDDDADVRSAASLALASAACRIEAVDGSADPEVLARRHSPDLLVLGSVMAADAGRSSALRKAFHRPVVPLFRPSVYTRQHARPRDLGPELMLGLADCRIRIDQHLDARVVPAEVSVRWGGFTLKLEPAAFAFQGRGLGLTRVENAILSLLMLHGGEVVSRSLIEDVVFHGKPKSRTNFISVHVSRLRAKLRDNRSDVFIENVRGDGYTLFWNRAFSTDCLPEPEWGLPSSGYHATEPTGFTAPASL